MKPIPVVFHIGSLQLHTYGIGLAVTFLFAFRYFERRLRRNNYPWQWLTGAFIWIIVAAVIGARIVHIAANFSFYLHYPLQMPQIWHGGLSSFGGLVFGMACGIFLLHKRCPELPTLQGLDLVMPVLAASWAIGRLLGPQLMIAGGGHPTHQWFGMYYAGQIGKRLPVPIFQSIDTFIIFGILLWVEKRSNRQPPGLITAIAATLWGFIRFGQEYLWLAYPGHSGAVAVEVGGVVLCVAGIAWIVALSVKHPGMLKSLFVQSPPALVTPPPEPAQPVDSESVGDAGSESADDLGGDVTAGYSE